MSARQRQRLEKALGGAAGLEEDDEEVLEEDVPRRSGQSAFAHIMDDDSDDDSVEEEVAREEKIEQRTKNVVEDHAGEVKKNAQAVSKKKKNKKKKPAKSAASAKREEAAEEDFLNELVEDSLKRQSEEDVSRDNTSGSISSRFSCPPDFLDPDKEVKRKLGRALSNAPAASKQAKKRPIRLPPGVSKTVGASISIPRYFVTPEPDWLAPPTFASGTGARMLRVHDDSNVFTFEASESYKAAQEHYKQLVLTYDPNHLIHMAQEHPFHVDTLLQLYDVFVSSGQNETAQIMLRRALFSLESWCSPAFRSQLGQGTCSLSLPNIENEDELLQYDTGKDCGLNGALLRALNLSMKVAGRKDCYETAMSLAKLLLSLTPLRDPTFAMLSIDYYAIKAKQYTWPIESHTSEEIRSLPSVAFGKAIAMNLLSKEPSSSIPRAVADSALISAICSFPQYALRVLETAQRAIPNKLRELADSSFSEISDRLCTLAIARQETLWTDDLVAWLADICNRGTLTASNEQKDIETMRSYARCRISDLSDKINLLPREELIADEQARLPYVQQVGQDNEQPRRPNVNLQVNDVLLMLQTLLPWTRLPNPGEEEDNDEWLDDVDEVD